MKTAALTLLALLPGCLGIGTDRMLFFTKSNVGLDIDTIPLTSELTISRREGVIEPSLGEAQTPPVFATFMSSQSGLQRLIMGIGMTFAAGDAALVAASLYGSEVDGYESDPNKDAYDSAIEVKAAADSPVAQFHQPDEVEPLIFGTDTSFGLKVGFSGQATPTPTTVKLGFNRTEFALSPVTASKKDAETYSVKAPSVFASIDSTSGVDEDSTQVQWRQFFATGQAATRVAYKKEARDLVTAAIAEADIGKTVLTNEVLIETLIAELSVLTEETDDGRVNYVYRTAMREGLFLEIDGYEAAAWSDRLSGLVHSLTELQAEPLGSASETEVLRRLLAVFDLDD